MLFFKIILNFKDIRNPGKATLTKWCQNNVSISITYQHQASKTNKTKNTITKPNLYECICVHSLLQQVSNDSTTIQHPISPHTHESKTTEVLSLANSHYQYHYIK